MIYLLGATGYLGNAYKAYFERRRIPFRSLTRSELDYTNLATLSAALRAEKPEFLINAAGYTGKPNVDACEIHKAECLAGNAVLPGIIAQACEVANVPWGHVSSGCIYTGSRLDGSGFTEEDAPNFSFRQNNCSFYSGSKALGEEVLASYPNVYIWRLRIPFDQFEHPRNYLTKLMRYPQLLDATNSLSELQEFVDASLRCWERRIPYGIYNMTNPGSVTTREVVDLIKKSGVCDREFNFFSSEDEFMRVAAKTPRSNCVMNSDKLRNAGILLTEVHEAIERDLRNWKKEGSAEPLLESRGQQPSLHAAMRHSTENRELADFESCDAGVSFARASW
jgi:dTDP-4-dehydrorhamnose reductase